MLVHCGLSSCVHASVTRRYCTKTANRSITQTTPYDSPGTLVFWRQQSLVGDAPFPLKFVLKVTHPRRTQRFRPLSADSASRPSTVIASEKSSIRRCHNFDGCNVMAAECCITICKRISAVFGSKVTESRLPCPYKVTY